MRPADDGNESSFRAALREWLRTHADPTGPDTLGLRDPAESRVWGKTLSDAGYAGLSWPTEHGGRGLSVAYQAILAEECALAQAPDTAGDIGLTMAGPAIIRYGTPAQQSSFLPRIRSGEALFCAGFADPEAHPEAGAAHPSATRGPWGYRLDGAQIRSPHADLADYCLLLARTGPDRSGQDGLTCFLVDMRSPGVAVRPVRQISGDTGHGQIVLTGVVTPADSVLGPVGDGRQVATTARAHQRGASDVARTARLSVVFDRLRQTAVAVGADRDPVLRRELADHYVRLQALRHNGYRFLAVAPGPETAILQLRWADAYQRMTAFGVRLLGAHGALDGPSAFWNGYWQRERLRSAAASIDGGTSEALRSVVAEQVLRLPQTR